MSAISCARLLTGYLALGRPNAHYISADISMDRDGNVMIVFQNGIVMFKCCPNIYRHSHLGSWRRDKAYYWVLKYMRSSQMSQHIPPKFCFASERIGLVISVGAQKRSSEFRYSCRMEGWFNFQRCGSGTWIGNDWLALIIAMTSRYFGTFRLHQSTANQW